MRKVAFISDGWKRLIAYAWVDGMMRFILDSGEEIGLYQFNCHGNWSRDEKHNHGEYNIYTLPDLSEFDGIIMDCINITDKEQFGRVVDLVRKSHKPAISIASDIEGIYYAGIDNKKSITEIMEHLYQKHHCRKYIFAGGPIENFENSLRVEAYLECLDRFGLAREENPVWYGDYDFPTGVRYFEEYLNSFRGRLVEFPDAFVCANDNIAAGFCYRAQQSGYQVPRDFKVTGFDNLDKAMYFEPQITTVGHMREHIGNKCMQILTDIWAGKPVPRDNFMPSRCIFTESCGCPNSGLLDYRKYAKYQIISEVDKQKNEDELVNLESDIVKSESYDEIFRKIGKYFMGLACDGFSIVVDKRVYEGADEACFPIDGYDWDHLVVAYATERGRLLDIQDPYELMSYHEEHGAGNAYMFTPIHFRDRTVGFSILKNGKFLYENPYFYDIHNTITKNMENLYKKLLLENANKKLREIYNRDQLTGVYNRIAYSEMIEPEYGKCRADNQRCVLAFLDADHFKEINDTYGHEKGDAILKEIARVLMDKCPKDGYVYRYGGDEFIAFFRSEETDAAERFRTGVAAELKKSDISVSIGVALTDPASDMRFDDYMKLADTDMYKVKAEKRRGCRDEEKNC